MASTASRLAAQAERSQATANAYNRLAELIATDPTLEVLREQEMPRLRSLAIEFDNDAEDLREKALDAGFDPSTI